MFVNMNLIHITYAKNIGTLANTLNFKKNKFPAVIPFLKSEQFLFIFSVILIIRDNVNINATN